MDNVSRDAVSGAVFSDRALQGRLVIPGQPQYTSPTDLPGIPVSTTTPTTTTTEAATTTLTPTLIAIDYEHMMHSSQQQADRAQDWQGE